MNPKEICPNRKLSQRKYVPKKGNLTQQKFVPKEICPNRNLSQGKFVQQKFDPMAEEPKGKLSQQKFVPKEICPKITQEKFFPKDKVRLG